MGSKVGSNSMSLRLQKKVLGKMGTKTVKAVIDDDMAAVMEDVHDLVVLQADKKTADTLLKNVVKIVVKIAILFKNSQFSKDEVSKLADVQEEFRKINLTLLSFYEMIGSYDYEFLAVKLAGLQDNLKNLLSNHLTEKSINRVDFVFRHFLQEAVLDQTFDPNVKDQHELLGRICLALKVLIEEDSL